jgi:hypothetical protein
MSDQLSPGDSCLVDVNPKKGFDRRPDWQPGVIKEPVGKGYMVLLDSQLNDSLVEPQWYPAKIVKPGRKVTALSDMTAKEFVARAQQDPREVLQVTPTRQVVFNRIEMPPVPIPKPDKPEKSPAFLAFCRQRECQNPGCGTPPPNEAHHQGTGSNERGVGQKVRDTKCVTLCNYCHAVYTGGPGKTSLCLPDRQATAQEKSLVLRSKEETELILRRAQMETIREALNYLPIEKRVEVLSKALALVPEEVLEEYLPKGEIR